MNYYKKHKQTILEKYGGDLNKPTLPDPPDSIGWGGSYLQDWLCKFIVVLEYKFETLLNNYLAKDITYDNTNSGLGSNNVQDAIDELALGTTDSIAVVDNTNSPYTIPTNKRIIKCKTDISPVILNLPLCTDFLNNELKIYIIQGTNNITINTAGVDKIIHNNSLKSIITITSLYGSVDLLALTDDKWNVESSNGII